MTNFEKQLNISANLTREDSTYLEKLGAQILALTKGRNIKDPELKKEPGYVQMLEKVLELVKARGAYLRATAAERNELRESIFEKAFGLQYEKQVSYLKDAGFVDKKGNIVGALDKAKYSVPTKEQVMTYLEGKRELLEVKMKQGFTRLLLVPIGMKLNKMVELTGEVLKKKQATGKLTYPGGQPIPDEEFNTDHPIYYEYWKSSDENDTGIYYAERFELEGHGGMPKQELLDSQTMPGWEILVVEDNQVLPKEDVIEDIGGRKRITANKNADQYRSLLQDDEQYRGEKGMTNEAWLTQLMMSVSETGEVLDDWDGEGCANISLGSYLPDANLSGRGAVAWSFWDRDFQQARLYWGYPDDQRPGAGFRSAV